MQPTDSGTNSSPLATREYHGEDGVSRNTQKLSLLNSNYKIKMGVEVTH